MNKISPSERINKTLKELLEKGYTRKHSVFYSFYQLAIQKAVQEILEQEVESYLGRGPYERTPEPANEGYRNRYKQRSLKAALGVPSPFSYPSYVILTKCISQS